MSGKLTWRRWLAQQALRWNSGLLPAEQCSWAAAMRAESRHLDDDREALDWALGCVRAAVAERLRAWRFQGPLSAHALGIIWIIIFILSSAFNVTIALAARMGWQRVASALGSWMQGFQYDRFLRFAEAIPTALLLLMGVVVVVFCVALHLSLRRRPSAFGVFCGALGLSLAGWLCQLGIPSYMQAMSAPHRWRIGICFGLTAAALCVLRFGGRAPNAAAHRWNGGHT